MYFMGNTRSGLAFMVRTHAQLPHSSLTLTLTIMHAYNQHTFYNIFNLHHSKKKFQKNFNRIPIHKEYVTFTMVQLYILLLPNLSFFCHPLNFLFNFNKTITIKNPTTIVHKNTSDFHGIVSAIF